MVKGGELTVYFQMCDGIYKLKQHWCMQQLSAWMMSQCLHSDIIYFPYLYQTLLWVICISVKFTDIFKTMKEIRPVS